MIDFASKNVIITGGTSGIGKATAIKFASLNATVIILGRDENKGTELVKSINKEKVAFYKCDVSDENEVNATITKIIDRFGKIDVLFNNAGIYPSFKPITDSDLDDWKKVIDVNLFGLFNVTKNTLPHLMRTHGVIINNASIAGLQSFISGQGYAYASSKAAIIQFTKMLAKKYSREVRINCICPGVIDTPLYFNLDKKAMSERIPAGFIGTSEDVANSVVFLASDMSKYIYGATIVIDGGMSL